MNQILLRAGTATLADWRAILAGATLALDPAARAGVDAAAAVIDRVVAEGKVAYGITTGFGKLSRVRIDAADLARLQVNLVRSHAVGVGAPLSDEVVRLIMALKIASLSRGHSGVRWAVIETLALMLERDVLPIIPSKGSVGASGDLAPLAHLAAVLIGEGRAHTPRGEMPGAAAMAAAGIAPVVLGPKEGLALLNGTQVSTALALAGLFALEKIFAGALVTGAMSTDAARGSDGPFDARIQAVRGHRGQHNVACHLRGLLAGSAIRESHRHGDDRVQDPYSLRCQPQVMGAVLDLMVNAAATLEIEADAATDNPLVFAEEGEILSGGNFHAEPVAFAADILALAATEIANLAERRIALLVDPAMSSLPAFLTPAPGVNSGLMIAQVTAAALAAETKQRATPASIDTIPTSANQEDHVSMATHAARRLTEMAENVAAVIGIEAVAAAQGIDLRAPLATSPRLAAAKDALRKEVAPLHEDRWLADDLAAGASLVADGTLARAAGLDPTLEGLTAS